MEMESGAIALRVSKQIQPLLKGLGGEIQAAVLADLLSLFLAGHFVVGSSEETDALREQLLKEHMDIVRELIPISVQQILATMQVEGRA